MPKCRKYVALIVFIFTGSLFLQAQLSDSFYPFHPSKKIEFSSSNLPIVIIDLKTRMADKSEDKRVEANMKIIWNKEGGKNSVTDTENIDYNGRIGIKYRGNSSFSSSDKKPFGVRTENAAGKKEAANILGMGADTDWALLAPFNDKSMIRDVLVFDLMRGSLEYVPTGKFCEVVLNGIYQGVYIMTARVRQGPSRINIKAPTSDTGDGLTGGYHLEIDREDDPGFWSNVFPRDLFGKEMYVRRPFYQFKYPDAEDMSQAQRNYIENHVHAMESAISGNSFKDPATGYRKYIDPVSLCDFIMAQEISKNIDSYRLSTPLYKYQDSVDPRFKFSIWDFNLSMGNANYKDGWCTEGWAYNTNRFGDTYYVPWMFKRIMQDETFMNELKNRWKSHRKDRFSMGNINTKIDSLKNLLQEAQVRNFQIWNRFGIEVWPNYYVSYSWDEEISFVKSWLTKRVEWIDSQWVAEKINYVVNGGIEATYSRGAKSGEWLAEWITSGDVSATKTVGNHRSGTYALSIKDNSRASQIITEIPPGKYKLSAWVMTLNNPGGYMEVSNFDTKGSKKTVDATDNKREYHLIEIDDIEVTNNFLQIAFVTRFRGGSEYRLWVDDISLVRKDMPVNNEKIKSTEDSIDIRANRAIGTVTVHIPENIFTNQQLDIYDITGRVIYQTRLSDTTTVISNVFSPNNIYIIKIGQTIRKVVM